MYLHDFMLRSDNFIPLTAAIQHALADDNFGQVIQVKCYKILHVQILNTPDIHLELWYIYFIICHC